jgi:hypothetical protein
VRFGDGAKSSTRGACAPQQTSLDGAVDPSGLSDRDLGVALARNSEAVEDCARGVGAVEGVEMDSGDVVIQEIVALFQGEVDADAADHFTIVANSFRGRRGFVHS